MQDDDKDTPATIFRPVEQPRLYVMVARQIAAHIRDAPLNPGTRLPPERDLARQFQVSRTTLREAMIALETVGLIEVLVGDGTYVRNRVSQNALPWERVADPGPHEQFRVRMLAERAAAEDAADNITDAEISVLERLVAAMKADIDGPEAETHRNAFHATIAAASRNSILADLIRDLWRMRSGEMWRTIGERVVRREHHVLALQDRKAILAALKARDKQAAGVAMARLLDRIRDRYFREIGD